MFYRASLSFGLSEWACAPILQTPSILNWDFEIKNLNFINLRPGNLQFEFKILKIEIGRLEF